MIKDFLKDLFEQHKVFTIVIALWIALSVFDMAVGDWKATLLVVANCIIVPITLVKMFKVYKAKQS